MVSMMVSMVHWSLQRCQSSRRPQCETNVTVGYEHRHHHVHGASKRERQAKSGTSLRSQQKVLSLMADLNHRPSPYKGDALTAVLMRRQQAEWRHDTHNTHGFLSALG